MKKYIINILLIVIWMFVIFSSSNQTGEISGEASDSLIIKIASIFSKEDLNKENSQEIADNYSFIFRKTAHLGAYFILGVLVFLLFNKMYGICPRTFIYTVIFCFIYACTDEIHQLFINGRAGQFRDVIIDTVGAFLATSLLTLFYSIKNKLLTKK